MARLPLIAAPEVGAADLRGVMERLGGDEAFVARLRAVFDDAELVELGFTVAGYLAWGRLHRAFGVPPSGEGYHAALAALAGAASEPRREGRPA